MTYRIFIIRGTRRESAGEWSGDSWRDALGRFRRTCHDWDTRGTRFRVVRLGR